MQHLITALKGFVIGAAMTVPGVSGGMIAILLDVFDRLISAISNIFKDFKKNVLFLLVFGLGGVSGMVLLSKLILYIEGLFPIPVRFFFIGAILAGIPLIWKKAGLSKFNIKSVLFALGGLAFVCLMTLIPKDLVSLDEGFGIVNILIFAVVGIGNAIALIAPGISFSHMLLIFGIYDKFYSAIETLDIPFLLCIVIPMGIAMLALVKGMDFLLKKYPEYTYSAILGFVVGSLKDVFVGFPTGLQIPASILTLVAGFAAVTAVNLYNKK